MKGHDFSRAANGSTGCGLQPLREKTAHEPASTMHQSARKWVPHPSSAWVGNHESHPATNPLLPCINPHENGCPIQALLGWETTNPSRHEPASTMHQSARKWVPHPSSAWVGNHEPASTMHQSARKWVPHPSSAWVGNHEPASTMHQSARKWVPIQALLGWETTNPSRARTLKPHPQATMATSSSPPPQAGSVEPS